MSWFEDWGAFILSLIFYSILIWAVITTVRAFHTIEWIYDGQHHVLQLGRNR